MRHMLASVILRLLGNRVVHEDADLPCYSTQSSLSKRTVEPIIEASVATAVSGESLFNRLLFILHGLLSSHQPSWLRSKHISKAHSEGSKNISGIDREVAENLQV